MEAPGASRDGEIGLGDGEAAEAQRAVGKDRLPGVFGGWRPRGLERVARGCRSVIRGRLGHGIGRLLAKLW